MRLTGNRYNEIEQTVLKLFMNIIIKGFPLDCFEICRQLNITLTSCASKNESSHQKIRCLIQLTDC